MPEWTPTRRLLAATAAAGTVGYVALSVAVHLHWLDASDLAVHRWIHGHAGPTFLGVHWSVWTAAGSTYVATTAIVLGAFMAWRSGAWRTTVVALVVAVAGGAIVDGFKELHDRPYPPHARHFVQDAVTATCPEGARCEVQLDQNSSVYCPPGSTCHFYYENATREEAANATVEAVDLDRFPDRQGNAYPSGHTMGATLTWGLALLLCTRAVRRAKGFDRGSLVAWAAVAVMGGVSRLPLYTHWWTDVVASWMLGLALLAAAILADDWWRARAGKPALPRPTGPPGP